MKIQQLLHLEIEKKHFGQWDHVRWYGLDIKNKLEKNRF